MDLDFRPRLRHCTLLDDPQSNQTKLIVGKEQFTLTRLLGERSDLLHMKSLFDGRHSVRDIARLTEISTANIISIIEAFQDCDLLQKHTVTSSISKESFIRKVDASSIMWRRQIGLHPLFGGLGDGVFRKEVFIGLLLETYHYVYMLPRMLKAISVDFKNKRYQAIVANYADEEMDHYNDLRKTLDQIERIAPFIDEAHPTVGTRNLIYSLQGIAGRSELSLICCLQLIEARASEATGAENHFMKIASHYGMTEILGPYIAHMRADIAMKHSNLLDEALEDLEVIPADKAHEAVNDMHDIKHSFDVFHDSVIDYYNDISNYIPRPRVDYFAL